MVCRSVLAALLLLAFTWAAQAQVEEPGDVADVPSQDMQAGGGDPHMRYFLIGPQEDAPRPEAGYALVVVLPGEDGGEGALPFVKRLYRDALGEDYVMAQLVAVKWTPEQEVVWPTARVKAAGAEFYTEQFVEAVIKDVRAAHPVDASRVYLLAWDSAGLAAYTVSLQADRQVAGSFIAMSEFKPHLMPPLKQAEGHAYYIYHSPQDEVTSFKVSNAAKLLLKQNGAKVQQVPYEGGHGWQGDFCADVREGIAWLRNATLQEEAEEPAAEAKEVAAQDDNVLLFEDFETGARMPQGWSMGGTFPGTRHFWDPGGAHSGRLSVGIARTDTRMRAASTWSRVVPRRRGPIWLHVTVWLKAHKVASGAVEVSFLDEKGNTTFRGNVCHLQGATHGWQEYSQSLRIPARTEEVRFALQLWKPGTIWMDDLKAVLQQRP